MPVEQQHTPIKKERLIFIDVMRGIAVLWMIETHVVDVALKSDLMNGWFFKILNISNGFVSVSFLFCAGAGLYLATRAKGAQWRAYQKPLWTYLRRLSFIMLIAYWLHLPEFSLARSFNFTPQQFNFWVQVDILQTIVSTSLFSLLIILAVKSEKALTWIFAGLAMATMLVTPAVRTHDPFAWGLWSPITAYFAGPPISNFPLFPWATYFFGGFAIASFFYAAKNKNLFAVRVMVGSLIMILSTWGGDVLTGAYDAASWWHISPAHTIFRLGGASIVFCALYLLEKYYKATRGGDALRLAGQESLYLYVSHLLLVYGSVANFGLKYLVGSRLNYLGVAAIIAAIMAFCYYTAWGWRYLKDTQPKKASRIVYAVTALMIAIFIVNPL